MTQTEEKESMQIEVSRRAGAIIGGVLIAGVILIGGTAAFADQASNHRQSEEAIELRMEKRNDHALDVLREEMHQQKIVAVRTAAKAARAPQKKHDRRVMRRIAKKQQHRREREKNAAQAAGYSSGHAQGHASGEVEGYFGGLDDAEPTQCSNDPDVPLPYC